MKKNWLFILALCLSSIINAQTQLADHLIPSLQYDNDFMTYLEFTMKDGFSPVKQAVGKMKFFEGRKIYAIEIIKLNTQKHPSNKITYFYLDTIPFAISIQKNGLLNLYYIKNGKISASKSLKTSNYNPFGGKKTLNIASIPPDKKIKKLKRKYLQKSTSLLSEMKKASKNTLGYRF